MFNQYELSHFRTTCSDIVNCSLISGCAEWRATKTVVIESE